MESENLESAEKHDAARQRQSRAIREGIVVLGVAVEVVPGVTPAKRVGVLFTIDITFIGQRVTPNLGPL